MPRALSEPRNFLYPAPRQFVPAIRRIETDYSFEGCKQIIVFELVPFGLIEIVPNFLLRFCEGLVRTHECFSERSRALRGRRDFLEHDRHGLYLRGYFHRCRAARDPNYADHHMYHQAERVVRVIFWLLPFTKNLTSYCVMLFYDIWH